MSHFNITIHLNLQSHLMSRHKKRRKTPLQTQYCFIHPNETPKHLKPALRHTSSWAVIIYMFYSCVVCQRGVSRGGTRGVGVGAGEGAGSGRGSVRRCWSGMPQRASCPLIVEPRGSVHDPLAKRAGGGMPDVAFCGQAMFLNVAF